MFLGTIWSLTNGRTRSEVHVGMLAVSCALLIFSTAVSMIHGPPSSTCNEFLQHLVVDLCRIHEGFVNRNSTPGGAIVYFTDGTESTWLIKNSIYIFQTLLGDGVVVSRKSIV